MEAFTTLTSGVVLLPIDDIDTDQIIPAEFMKGTDKVGLGNKLFFNWRYRQDGSPNPDFALNKAENRSKRILIAGKNFGCGSSREHAPWALTDYGFRAVIAPSFADIFRNNALKNGLLPLTLKVEEYELLLNTFLQEPSAELTIDLSAQQVILPDGRSFSFPIDNFSKTCLLNGMDELGYLLSLEARISQYETQFVNRSKEG